MVDRSTCRKFWRGWELTSDTKILVFSHEHPIHDAEFRIFRAFTVFHHTSLALLVLFLFSISARRSLASDVGTGLVLHYSSKRGAGVGIFVACFVKFIVHYPFLTNDIFRRARSPVCCHCFLVVFRWTSVAGTVTLKIFWVFVVRGTRARRISFWALVSVYYPSCVQLTHT